MTPRAIQPTSIHGSVGVVVGEVAAKPLAVHYGKQREADLGQEHDSVNAPLGI